MSVEREALAGLAEDVAAALVRYATALRADVDAPAAAEAVVDAPRGKRQREVLALEGIDTDDGMTAGAVAEAVGIRQPNAYKTLSAMVDGGWLEVVPGVEPAHWRRSSAKGGS